MTARTHWEPMPVQRERPARGTTVVNPHTVTLLGAPGSPIYDLVIDRGTTEPVTVVRLTADLAHILKSRLDAKLNNKHIGERR